MPSGLHVLGRRKRQDAGITATELPPALPPVPRLSPEKLNLLARWQKDSIQFTNNPFGGVGAITLGNAVVFNGNPNDPRDSNGADWTGRDGMTPEQSMQHDKDHEDQHVKQGEMLGPLYLPSHLLGGAYALARDHEWHGDSNWNERGPEGNPPRPWSRRAR